MGESQTRSTWTIEGAIETFIIDWPVLIFIGLLFGYFAPGEAAWSSRAFKSGLVTCLVFTSIAFVSYAVAPHWMWMYFLDPGPIAWSLPLIAIGYLVTFVLGFAAAVGLRVLSRGHVIAAALSALIAEVVVVAITWDRYRSVGTTQEWLTGEAFPLLGTSPQGPVRVIASLGPLFAVVLITALIWTIRGRRASVADR